MTSNDWFRLLSAVLCICNCTSLNDWISITNFMDHWLSVTPCTQFNSLSTWCSVCETIRSRCFDSTSIQCTAALAIVTTCVFSVATASSTYVRKMWNFLLRFSVRLNFYQQIFFRHFHFTHHFVSLLPEFLCTIKLVSVTQVINKQPQPCHRYWRQSKGNMDWAAVVIHQKHSFQFLCQNFRHDCCKYEQHNATYMK